MKDIGPDAKTQIHEQNTRVDASIYGGFLRLPYWIRLATQVCLALWALNFVLGVVPLEERGTFGDSFGAVNSIFSAFALLGVAWSISMQRKELKVAKKDRNDTRKILRDQQDNIILERFETTFFQLFTAFNSVADVMDVELNDLGSTEGTGAGAARVTRGRAVFEEYLHKLEDYAVAQELKNRQSESINLTTPDETAIFVSEISEKAYQAAYDLLFEKHGDDIGRYFRTLYTVMRFIEKSKINKKMKRFYFKFLRAQLSMHESTFLGLNYNSRFTTQKFNKLCFYYGMAKNADREHPLITISGGLPVELYGRNELNEWADAAYRRYEEDKEAEVYLYNRMSDEDYYE